MHTFVSAGSLKGGCELQEKNNGRIFHDKKEKTIAYKR